MKKIPLLLLAFALGLGVPRAAVAQVDPFLGQIAWVAFTFNPRGWANCDGQLLPIAQNTALFSLLGTTYGGDGRVTFALPDMRGRVPIHLGSGPGLTPCFSVWQPIRHGLVQARQRAARAGSGDPLPHSGKSAR